MILRVNPADVVAIWPQLEPLVITALRDSETHDAEDVRMAILGGQSTLFIQWADENVVEAFAATQFAIFPKGVWLNLWLVGANPDCQLDNYGFYETLDVFRQLNGCRGFQCTGARHGWLKRFTGIKVEGVNMRQTIITGTKH